jgi:hypothetical protein
MEMDLLSLKPPTHPIIRVENKNSAGPQPATTTPAKIHQENPI